MVNPDSELYREHPDWVLAAPRPAAAPVAQPAGPRPRRARRVGVPAGADGRAAARVRRRLREVGPQPRPARGRVGTGRHAGRAPPGRGALRAARRAAAPPPARRVGVLRVRRRPHRSRRARARAAGLDVGHDRRAAPASRSSAGRCSSPRPSTWARTSRPRRSHQTGRTHAAGLPRRHGAVRLVRHRVGPHAGRPRTSWPRCAGGCSATAPTAGCCTAGAPCGSSPATRRCGCTASSRPTGAARCSRTSSSTSRPATAASCSGCRTCAADTAVRAELGRPGRRPPDVAGAAGRSGRPDRRRAGQRRRAARRRRVVAAAPSGNDPAHAPRGGHCDHHCHPAGRRPRAHLLRRAAGRPQRRGPCATCRPPGWPRRPASTRCCASGS